MNQGRRNRRLYPSGHYLAADGAAHTVRTTDLPDLGTDDLPAIEVAFAAPPESELEQMYRDRQRRGLEPPDTPRDDAAEEARTIR